MLLVRGFGVLSGATFANISWSPSPHQSSCRKRQRCPREHHRRSHDDHDSHRDGRDDDDDGPHDDHDPDRLSSVVGLLLRQGTECKVVRRGILLYDCCGKERDALESCGQSLGRNRLPRALHIGIPPRSHRLQFQTSNPISLLISSHSRIKISKTDGAVVCFQLSPNYGYAGNLLLLRHRASGPAAACCSCHSRSAPHLLPPMS